MKMYNAFWWCIFIIIATLLQKSFVGIDFYIIGFIILLQEEDYRQMLFVAPVLFLIQEGITTFSFGTTLMCYFSAIILIIMGRWLFEVENFLFMFLFSSALSFSYILIFMLFSRLQGIPYSQQELMDYNVIQALVMPLLWWIAVFLRPKRVESAIL